jgi:energy-coupling factor transporter ATP-binding protein EcfA2
VRYRDVVKFDPIESVVQLRDADKHEEARGLVASYVISPEMAERLEATVFSQLQFDEPSDNKGVFVVGNYGTGKSHLMSLISAIAEHEDLVEHISDSETAKNAKKIAGRFKVVRTEIGAVRMDLRTILWRQLENALAGWGVDFRFPETEMHASNKPAFEDMMAAFEEVYPDKGLLLVVDELLDYLRSGTDHEQIRNLNFLREVGEVCKGTRFRFLTGVQEAIFDSPRFEFAADTLLRVKDRFEQFLIARRDVKFVVAERLLKKTADQEARVRAHLEPFAKFYGKMNERMEEFFRLFPVHPDYIDTFERIFIVEKREVLRSLSQMMRKILDDEVPEDCPGTISYDAYWRSLVENPAFRSEPSVREVIEVGTRLEERIEAAFPTSHQKALALQLVHGLGVHRLTTGDFHSEMGATAQELRDSLCVYDPMVEGMSDDPADDLAGQIRVILNKARKTVDGTYLGLNAENDQFYVRVTDEPDPDTLIEKRREILDTNYLNRYYFEALKRVMELTDDPVVSGRQIWRWEITWLQRNAPRKGYLFFGAPDERPTAQPPRDFYLYFLRPYDAPRFKDEKRPDEVFFRLSGPNEEFSEPLAKYAAALDLAGNASGASKATFQSKADGYLRELVKWLRQNMATAFEVTYGGKTLPILQWAKGTRGAAAETVREVVQSVASACLAPHFEETAPEYPRFSIRITSGNLEQTAKEALGGIAGPSRSRQANAALDALELLDGDRLEPRNSRYAKRVLSLLEGKGAGQVTNREELVEHTPTGEFFAPDTFRLEPEWLVVVLAALVHSGDLVLALPGKKLGASDLDVLAATPLSDLADFKHVERPKGWDKPALGRV